MNASWIGGLVGWVCDTRRVPRGRSFCRGFGIPALVAILCVWVLSAPATDSWASEAEKCSMCGMDLSKYPHTRYVLTTEDGRKQVTCGVQCGLSVHLGLGTKWKSATASDLLSNRAFDVQKGFFVFRSSVITDMAPGFIAFSRRADAEKFARGFGGDVMTYQEALERWKSERKQPPKGR
ncbi:MAG: nitrous oxide reductase accessory protein NosL [Thermodesulfobacteriota bacterium]